MKKPLSFNYFKIILTIILSFSVKHTLAQSFRGMSITPKKEIWISGSKGTVIYTSNNGTTYDTLSPKKFQNKDFRDIHAIDRNSAVIMSAGDSAVILKTYNHGQSWNVVYEDNRPGIFFDVIEINNQTGVGIALGDPLPDSLFNKNDNHSTNKHFVALYTPDYGNHWYPIPNGTWNVATNNLSSMYAASGTSLVFNKLEIDKTTSKWKILMDFYFSGGGNTAAEIRQVILSFQVQEPKQTFEYLKFDYQLKFPPGDGWGIYGMQKINDRLFCFGGHWKYPNAKDSFSYMIQLSNVTYTIGKNKIKSQIATLSTPISQNGYRSGGCFFYNPQNKKYSGISVGSNGIDTYLIPGKQGISKSSISKKQNFAGQLKGSNVCLFDGEYFWIAGNKGLVAKKSKLELFGF